MGTANDFACACLKSQIGGGVIRPSGGTLFVSGKDSDKSAIVPAVRALIDLGFKVIATVGTADYLAGQGLDVAQVNKVAQGRPHIVARIKDGEVAPIYNTTQGCQSHTDYPHIRPADI